MCLHIHSFISLSFKTFIYLIDFLSCSGVPVSVLRPGGAAQMKQARSLLSKATYMLGGRSCGGC